MKEKAPIPPTTLGEALGTVRVLLGRIRKDAEEVETILSSLQGESAARFYLPESQRILKVTQGGSIRNLDQQIFAVLDRDVVPQTSEEIAAKLYTRDTGISFDLFKRRVIVTVSAMSRRDKPSVVPAFAVAAGKEKHWTTAEKKERMDRVDGALKTLQGA